MLVAGEAALLGEGPAVVLEGPGVLALAAQLLADGVEGDRGMARLGHAGECKAPGRRCAGIVGRFVGTTQRPGRARLRARAGADRAGAAQRRAAGAALDADAAAGAEVPGDVEADLGQEGERTAAGAAEHADLGVAAEAPARAELAQDHDAAEGPAAEGLVSSVQFAAPLAESTAFQLELPKGLKDAAGRALSNADSFPLGVATGGMPPLAKFAGAPFGIVEAGASPAEPAMLPVALRHVQADLQGFDAVLSPTVPMVAPALAPLLSSDSRFFAINGMLLRNPSVVNMLDGCALSLPCHLPGQMPVGLMVWGPAMADDLVLGVGLAIEAALAAADSDER